MRSFTDKEIFDRAIALKLFKTVPKGYWIVGIRSNADIPNKFDDKFFLYKDSECLVATSGTTHPGTPILLNFTKYSNLGACVLSTNKWYSKAFVYGMHNGKMPALRQISPFYFHRDNDKDLKAEEIGKEYLAICNTNFHFNTYNVFKGVKLATKENVDSWSAGCQVCNVQEHYEKIINLTKTTSGVGYLILQEF